MISEVFTSSLESLPKHDWQDYPYIEGVIKHASFEIDGVTYKVEFAPMHVCLDNLVKSRIYNSECDGYIESGVEVAFFATGLRTGAYGRTGRYQLIPIMNMVVKAILEYIKEYRPTFIEFQPNDEKLDKLYRLMGKKLVNSTSDYKPYSIDSRHHIYVVGEYESVE